MADPESDIGTEIVATAVATAATVVDPTGMTGAAISMWFKNQIAETSRRRVDEFYRELERTLAW